MAIAIMDSCYIWFYAQSMQITGHSIQAQMNRVTLEGPGRNKISTVFRLPHQSGSLHEILTVFAVQGLNLLKIESRPIPGRGWEYLFFLDFTGDLAAPEMDGVLHELGQLAAEFRILGNFRGYEP